MARISVENLLKFGLINKLSIILAWEIVSQIIFDKKELIIKFHNDKLDKFIAQLEAILDDTSISSEIEKGINKKKLNIEDIIQATRLLNNDEKLTVFNDLLENIKNEYVQQWISSLETKELFNNLTKNECEVNMSNENESSKENLTEDKYKNTNKNNKNSLKENFDFLYKKDNNSNSFTISKFINKYNKYNNKSIFDIKSDDNELEENLEIDKNNKSSGQGGQ